MKVTDFKIGDIFTAQSFGKKWKVTDIGSRVVIAINISQYEDKSWFNGPPYAVVEYVWDEDDLEEPTLQIVNE